MDCTWIKNFETYFGQNNITTTTTLMGFDTIEINLVYLQFGVAVTILSLTQLLIIVKTPTEP